MCDKVVRGGAGFWHSGTDVCITTDAVTTKLTDRQFFGDLPLYTPYFFSWPPPVEAICFWHAPPQIPPALPPPTSEETNGPLERRIFIKRRVQINAGSTQSN